MSRINVDALHSEQGGSSNIELDDSRNVTFKGNAQVDGNVTVTGTLPANKLTGALPAISGASLTGIPTRTQPFRNLVVNGACRVAQRGTTQAAHTGHGYFTVDRFYTSIGGENEGREEAQITLTSSDTGPWEKGFRNAFQVTNGNQTSTDAGDYLWAMLYLIEARDIANSNWNHKDPNSNLTISFWVKSSVAQNFYGYFRTSDGTSKYRAFETGALSANTWTKITKTIPGHADCQIDNDNGHGFQIYFYGYAGTDKTDSGVSLDTWYTWPNGSETTPDWPASMDDWWRTNDATLAFTGLQVEAGDTATEFEHRSYGEELARCHRYYQSWRAGAQGVAGTTSAIKMVITSHTVMRDFPSASIGGSGGWRFGDMVSWAGTASSPTINLYDQTDYTDKLNSGFTFELGGFSGLTTYRTYMWEPNGTYKSTIQLSSEL